MNNVTLIGRLTAKPEARIYNGTTFVNANIAVDRDYKDSEGKKITDFINISATGKTAEFFVNYLDQGRLVAIQGSIRVDRYETKEGKKASATKVAVSRVKPLDSRKNTMNSNTSNGEVASGIEDDGAMFEPAFDPSSSLDPQGFQAIDDDDIPF